MTSVRTSLAPEQAAAIGHELDTLKVRVTSDLGDRDAAYIRSIIDSQQVLEMDGRGPLLAGIMPVCWCAETTMLAVWNILNNVESDHDVMSGQQEGVDASYYRVNPVYAFLLTVLFQYSVALHDLETERTHLSQVEAADKRAVFDEIWAQSRRELLVRSFRVNRRVSVDDLLQKHEAFRV